MRPDGKVDAQGRSWRPLGQAGQVLLLYLFFLLPMTMIVLSVYNVGILTTEKVRLQNAADNAAYSAAVWEARYMNLAAYMNRAMVANYDAMATLVAVWSFVDAWDGFIQLARAFVTILSIGQIDISPLHKDAFHPANDVVSQVVGGREKSPAAAIAIETYTSGLSYAQAALYYLTQAGRQEVAKSIAWSVDPDIQYSILSEIFNFASLEARVPHAFESSEAGGWKGTDAENGLRRTIERSLNKMAAGGGFRDSSSFLPEPFGTFVRSIEDIPCTDISVGPKGFDAPGFDHVTGEVGGGGSTKIVRDDKLYQRDRVGINIGVDEECTGGLEDFVPMPSFTLAHESDDEKNIGFSLVHFLDEEDHLQYFTRNGLTCDEEYSEYVGIGSMAGALAIGTPIAVVGAIAAGGVCAYFTQNEKVTTYCAGGGFLAAGIGPAMLGAYAGGTVGRFLAEQAGFKPCATSYELQTKLSEMSVTTYKQDPDVGRANDGQRLEGPTILVYFRKANDKLPLFRGLGQGLFLFDPEHPIDIEAYSFAKVYSTQRPGGESSDRESLFNPFWAARLEQARPFGVALPH